MKLRQAEKILKRSSIACSHHHWYGTPLPKGWSRYKCIMHKADAVAFHHGGPFGRMANKWSNDHIAKICKAEHALNAHHA